ncbi:MAG: FtsQ-type POTRA domain-containing protein, partial [Methylobacteriaceae bacterium]|nr:FtsQ-type POTRA domain-containing protein [Methylobacteriaceae bacterium]
GAGFLIGGGYETMSRERGGLRDMAGRLLGFELEAVTISGQKELAEIEILEAAGVSSRNAVPFIDAAELRRRLRALPLVRDAEVSKLYPDRLVITVNEREPYALWQREGQVMVVARDGTVIDELRDERFLDLPFVAGEGANGKVEAYAALLAAAAELRVPVKAGILVSGRRWTLRTQNNIDIKLPELKAAEALARLAQLDREHRILQKDILSIDLRIDGRVTARLSEDAYAARLEKTTRKTIKPRASET